MISESILCGGKVWRKECLVNSFQVFQKIVWQMSRSVKGLANY